MDGGKTLIAIGVVLIAAGLFVIGWSRFGFGQLPGDIVIERGNFRFYLPLGTCLLVSALLSLALWAIHRM